jgi:peptidoglycan hydrolase CwlO-like protein|tara:strand:- start:74 stop:346 length:273 start_codon:yes stop_codon:yes gene_type:complete
MSKAISADSQIHISIALLVKATMLVAVITGSWYQAQMKFAEIDRKLEDLTNKVTVLSASVEGMEQEHIKELEETITEQKTLLQRMGLKKP